MPTSPPPVAVDRKAAHLADGAAAEQWAFDYLRARGLEPVARNFSCREGELDLVMADGAVLVVVEVRYRRSNAFGGGAASVDRRKQRRIVRATQRFLAAAREWEDRDVRFDVVAVSPGTPTPGVEWIRDAFEAG